MCIQLYEMFYSIKYLYMIYKEKIILLYDSVALWALYGLQAINGNGNLHSIFFLKIYKLTVHVKMIICLSRNKYNMY